MKELDELRAEGAVPTGQYRWVDCLQAERNHPLPPAFFNGSKDGRFGFQGESTYGRLDEPHDPRVNAPGSTALIPQSPPSQLTPAR